MYVENKPFRIFLVDDDQFILQLYGLHLQNLGYKEVHLFDSGAVCLKELVQQPDLIFLDHQMDPLNGLEVLKKIKRFNPGIYVVFLSGQENIETALSSLKYGAFDYIVKGDKDLENIKRVIDKILEIREVLSRTPSRFTRKFLSILYILVIWVVRR